MTSRRKQAADTKRQTRDAEEERREPGSSDRETPSKSRSKGLSRCGRAQQTSLASRSDREEDFCSNKKTPKRRDKCKSWTSTVNSPSNDSEQQHEIFWDPNSPTSFMLDGGKKKQTARKCTVEISDIVNRIAPKDEKPTNSDAAYLGIWIGDDAMPCTPVVTRPRTKLSRYRILKTEEELMELAKQLDRNLVEHQEQHGDEQEETAHSTVHSGTVQENGDDSFLENIPEEDEVSLALNSVSQHSEAQCSQKSVNQEAEEALNALFDCSTQKVSGRLSQGLSDISTSSVQAGSLNTKNGRRENQLLTKDPYQENTNSYAHDLSTKLHSDLFQGEKKSSVQAVTGEKEVAADMVLSVSSSQDDFEDDWGEDILEDDSFVMQITQNPESIATPKSNKPPEKSKHSTALDRKYDCASKSSASKEHYNFKFVSKKLTGSEGPKMKTITAHVQKTEERSCNREGSYKIPTTQLQGPSEGQVVAQNNTAIKSTSNCEVSKSLSSRGERDQLANKNVNTNAESLHCDEWNDPKFSDEVLDMFCKSDNLWDDEDDDLLYQVCNDVETLSQVHVSEETTSFSSLSCKESIKTVSDDKIGSHDSTTYSFSSKFSGCAPNTNKGIAKGSSPASVSGNCLNTFQKCFSQRTKQASGTFNRSNAKSPGVECLKTKTKEINSQSSLSSTFIATTSNAHSKYSLTRTKPSTVLSVPTNKALLGSESSSKGNPFLEFGESNKINTLTNAIPAQQSTLKRHLSESIIHSSKVFVSEDRSKKCSTEEIERKKQEALARRKIKARTFSSDNAPT